MNIKLNKILSFAAILLAGSSFAFADYNGGQIRDYNGTYTGNITVNTTGEESVYVSSNCTTTLSGNIRINTSGVITPSTNISGPVATLNMNTVNSTDKIIITNNAMMAYNLFSRNNGASIYIDTTSYTGTGAGLELNATNSSNGMIYADGGLIDIKGNVSMTWSNASTKGISTGSSTTSKIVIDGNLNATYAGAVSTTTFLSCGNSNSVELKKDVIVRANLAGTVLEVASKGVLDIYGKYSFASESGLTTAREGIKVGDSIANFYNSDVSIVANTAVSVLTNGTANLIGVSKFISTTAFSAASGGVVNGEYGKYDYEGNIISTDANSAITIDHATDSYVKGYSSATNGGTIDFTFEGTRWDITAKSTLTSLDAKADSTLVMTIKSSADYSNITLDSFNSDGITVLELVIDGYTGIEDDVFYLINSGTGIVGSVELEISGTELSEGLLWDTSMFAEFGYIRVVSIPEPATVAVVMGALAIGFAACRKRSIVPVKK